MFDEGITFTNCEEKSNFEKIKKCQLGIYLLFNFMGQKHIKRNTKKNISTESPAKILFRTKW